MLDVVVTFLIILLGASLTLNLFQFFERLWWRDALTRALHEILELRDRLEQRASPVQVAAAVTEAATAVAYRLADVDPDAAKAALAEYHRVANAEPER